MKDLKSRDKVAEMEEILFLPENLEVIRRMLFREEKPGQLVALRKLFRGKVRRISEFVRRLVGLIS